MGERRSAHEQALRLLAQRDHFRAELQRKLLARGYEADEVEAALDRLTAAGYLDDAAAAKAWVASRQQRQGLGKNRLRAELQRKGVGGEAVAEALGAVGDDDELARAREAADRWRRGGSRQPGPAGRAALARHLDRKGFSRRAVMAALGAAGADAVGDLDGDGDATLAGGDAPDDEEP